MRVCGASLCSFIFVSHVLFYFRISVQFYQRIYVEVKFLQSIFFSPGSATNITKVSWRKSTILEIRSSKYFTEFWSTYLENRTWKTKSTWRCANFQSQVYAGLQYSYTNWFQRLFYRASTGCIDCHCFKNSVNPARRVESAQLVSLFMWIFRLHLLFKLQYKKILELEREYLFNFFTSKVFFYQTRPNVLVHERNIIDSKYT